MNKDAIVKLKVELNEDFRSWDDPEISELETLPDFILLLSQLESKGLLPDSINLSDCNVNEFISNNSEILFELIAFDRDFDDEKEITVSYFIPVEITYSQYLADKEFFNQNFKCSLELN